MSIKAILLIAVAVPWVWSYRVPFNVNTIPHIKATIENYTQSETPSGETVLALSIKLTPEKTDEDDYGGYMAKATQSQTSEKPYEIISYPPLLQTEAQSVDKPEDSGIFIIQSPVKSSDEYRAEYEEHTNNIKDSDEYYDYGDYMAKTWQSQTSEKPYEIISYPPPSQTEAQSKDKPEDSGIFNIGNPVKISDKYRAEIEEYTNNIKDSDEYDYYADYMARATQSQTSEKPYEIISYPTPSQTEAQSKDKPEDSGIFIIQSPVKSSGEYRAEYEEHTNNIKDSDEYYDYGDYMAKAWQSQTSEKPYEIISYPPLLQTEAQSVGKPEDTGIFIIGNPVKISDEYRAEIEEYTNNIKDSDEYDYYADYMARATQSQTSEKPYEIISYPPPSQTEAQSKDKPENSGIFIIRNPVKISDKYGAEIEEYTNNIKDSDGYYNYENYMAKAAQSQTSEKPYEIIFYPPPLQTEEQSVAIPEDSRILIIPEKSSDEYRADIEEYRNVDGSTEAERDIEFANMQTAMTHTTEKPNDDPDYYVYEEISADNQEESEMVDIPEERINKNRAMIEEYINSIKGSKYDSDSSAKKAIMEFVSKAMELPSTEKPYGTLLHHEYEKESLDNQEVSERFVTPEEKNKVNTESPLEIITYDSWKEEKQRLRNLERHMAEMQSGVLSETDHEPYDEFYLNDYRAPRVYYSSQCRHLLSSMTLITILLAKLVMS